MQTLGSNIFEDCEDHLFEHTFGAECDHLSCLTRMVTKSYVALQMKTYSKRYTEIIAHQNKPSVRHSLNKVVLFKNQ